MRSLPELHKRIREVNKQREEKGQKPMFSFLDDEIVAILNIIKEDVDAKVYDRNDILKKDAYFGRTVMALINGCLYHFPQIRPEMDDYKFIQQQNFTTIYQPIQCHIRHGLKRRNYVRYKRKNIKAH